MINVKSEQRIVIVPPSIKFGLNNTHPLFTVLLLTGVNNRLTRIYIKSDVRVGIGAGYISLTAYNPLSLSLSGTYYKLITNSIRGLEKDYRGYIELRGLGYRVKTLSPTCIEFFVGYSHSVKIDLPPGASAAGVGVKSRVLELRSPDWGQLNQLIDRLKKVRPSNPYKEKGIFKKRERALLKEGKKKKI